MYRIFSALPGLLILALIACGGGQDTERTALPESEPELQQAPADTFDLMSYSALDTNSGVFYGEYDERVNDEITVVVRLEVTLEDGRITGITLRDTTWVHPRAAEIIPQRIIEQQRLPVDVVSGASVASWSIMTATAVALEIDLTVLDELDDETGTTDN
ncbi:MAG: hypothetical protein FVQ81_16295 [Candidatus Glassbacteria bacterium]|nr:hypothetical protein [Candidatus Glassbacteria bacterium]